MSLVPTHGGDPAFPVAGPPRPTAQALLDAGRQALSAKAHLRALRLFRAALRSSSEVAIQAQAAYYMGFTLRAARHFKSALAAFVHTLRLQPHHPHALREAGSLARHFGQPQEALQLLEQAEKLNPTDPATLRELSETHAALGQSAPAGYFARLARCAAFLAQPAITPPPEPNPWLTLGLEAVRVKHSAAALALFHLAVQHRPQSAKAHRMLGVVQLHAGHFDAAIAAFRAALRLCHPDGRREEASTTPPEPDFLLACNRGLGTSLAFSNQTEGLTLLRQLTRDHPQSPETSFAFSNALLAHGLYPEGFLHYESRFAVSYNGFRPRAFPQPQWDGSPQPGRTLLLHAEQGFGDTVQFLRFAPLAAARGLRVLVEVQPTLVALLQDLVKEEHAGINAILPRGADSTPSFDYQLRLLSLPRVLGTTAQALPPALLPSRWRLRPRQRTTRLRAGLVWAGNPSHVHDHLRSIPLAAFAPLVANGQLTLVSLQQGATFAGFAETHPNLKDWTETAQVLSTLDLLISVDTAVAHLAASMGLPTWLLVANYPDWRWGLTESTTPWYPSMRIFRQKGPHTWPQVVDEVVRALEPLP